MLAALLIVLSSCGGGGGGGSGSGSAGNGPPPFIVAELDSFPPGAAPPGITSNALVLVVDDASGDIVTTATVSINGVALPYNATDEVYEGNVAVAPGAAVTLTVTTAGKTYTASATQFTA